ncbi:DUF6786 family protein [Foetidibacter luteolus]|uniref:DUF6786 family protein n=1 Tax=Foetidibacter luteolus TaxID=2608880 RepID=UPI00129AFE40|nr:DUF6786 family protein [Foetidibacter luteolus]
MKSMLVKITGVCYMVSLIACGNGNNKETNPSDSSAAPKGSYAYDAAFLQKHNNKILELKDKDGNAKVLLSADYQGRVMTSTATGDSGASYGWLNYSLIEAPEKKKQFNPVGGEERFWLGPEGGQYSIYFKGKDSFNFANWQVPAIIDTVAYDVAEADDSHAVFKKEATITNWSGTEFNLAIERTVSLLGKDAIAQKLGVTLPGNVNAVGYETVNKVKNAGAADWKKDKGLLSIWLLAMLTPTEETMVIIPFNGVANARSYITDNYFGTIPPDRLKVKDSVLYFTADGKKRSKLGLSPVIAKGIAGSYDFKKNVLTLILFPVDKKGSYVNSKWELQKEPYKGDAVNAYNDGPLEDGTQMGPFYEIESSSAASELKAGEVQEYRQATVHLQGDYASLKQLVKQVLGVELDEVRK